MDHCIKRIGLRSQRLASDPQTCSSRWGRHSIAALQNECWGHSAGIHKIRRLLVEFCEWNMQWGQFYPVLLDEEAAAVPAMAMMAAECFSTPVILFHEPEPDLSHSVFDPFPYSDKFDGSPICMVSYKIADCDHFDLVLTEDQLLLDAVAQGEYSFFLSFMTNCDFSVRV